MHPLWAVCVFVRLIILISAGVLARNTKRVFRGIGAGVLLLMGGGFLVKSLTGSNDEVQVAKVFWHETRIVHAVLYILSAHYLFEGNPRMCVLILGIDLLFSLLYRTVGVCFS